jgi:hypothetical protein
MARRTIKDLFTNNLGYKLIALLLALLLWFDVRTEKVTVIDYPVPVTLSIVGDEMTTIRRPRSRSASRVPVATCCRSIRSR